MTRLFKKLKRLITGQFLSKYRSELNYWKEKYIEEGYRFENGFYRKNMLGIAQEIDDAFLHDKIVVDFGCGPRGSLVWTDAPGLKIGVDVLADKYFDSFATEMARHNCLYIKSSEKRIPMPDDYVDVVFTLNSMDHTDNFEAMLDEIFRVLKKGGEFIGSFNMNERWTPSEPQRLTFEMIEELLFPKLDLRHKLITFREGEKTYTKFVEYEVGKRNRGEVCILCVRGRKLAL